LAKKIAETIAGSRRRSENFSARGLPGFRVKQRLGESAANKASVRELTEALVLLEQGTASQSSSFYKSLKLCRFMISSSRSRFRLARVRVRIPA
jgi:hypothetical protein